MNKKKQTRYRSQTISGSNKQLSFLPDPDFTPELPRKNTLTFCALSLMMEGKKITHLDFQRITSSWRLAAYIRELRKLGWNIVSDEITHATASDPIARSICQYSLDKKITGGTKKLLDGCDDAL